MDQQETQEEILGRIAGLIYAGGRGMRMGGVDKALLMHNGAPLIAHMCRAMRLYTQDIFITRQKDQADLSLFANVLTDATPDQGPLAGLVCAINALQDFDLILTAPVDALALPRAYLPKMMRARKPHAMAQTAEGLHPTFALIDRHDSAQILQAYENGGRALRIWAQDQNCGYAQFATDEWRNINQKEKI